MNLRDKHFLKTFHLTITHFMIMIHLNENVIDYNEPSIMPYEEEFDSENNLPLIEVQIQLILKAYGKNYVLPI